MMQKLTLRAMLLSGVCLLPLGAMAADLGAAPPAAAPSSTTENSFTIGVLGVFGTNTGQYGRYNGFTYEGADAVGAFSSETLPVWDSNNTNYYEFGGYNLDYQSGDELGHAVYPTPSNQFYEINNFKDHSYTDKTHNDLGPEATLYFNIGDQGHWALSGYYDAITYTGNIIDSIYTVNGNHGYLNGSLQQWGGATSPSAPTPGAITAYSVPQLLATGAEQPVQVGTRRDTIGFVGKYIWNDWTFTGAVHHQHKEGSLEESYYGQWGGMAFALPVDYDQDRYDVTAFYATPQVQAQFNYFLSNFTDNYSGVYLPWPTSGSGGNTPYERTGLYSTPPSNWAQYWTGMVGYNVLPSTRLSANARFGLEKQDNGYPSNTGDPIVNGTPGGINFSPGWTDCNGTFVGTSSCSLDATADVFQGTAAIDSTPVTNLNTRVAYSADLRRVHIDQSGPVYGDAHNADAGPYGIQAYVVPQEWTKQKVKADADYLFWAPTQTKLQLGYVYDNTSRSNAQVGSSDTNTGTIGLLSMLTSDLQGSINYEHDDRSGVLKYWLPWSNLESGNPNDTAAGTPSGAYYQAPMTADGGTARLEYSPEGQFSGGLQFRARNEDYHYPSITPGIDLVNSVEGIKQDYNILAGINGNYRPSDEVSFHAYYTFERIFYDNRGNGACSTPAQAATSACTGTVGYFQNKSTDDVHTVGLDAEWKATDRLKINADYTFSFGAVMFTQFNGVFVASPNQTYQNVSNYPDEDTTMHTLTVKAKYKLTDNMQVAVLGGWSYFKYSNWQDNACAVMPTNGVCTGPSAGTSISILTPGYRSPNYNVGLIGAALKVKW